MPDGDGTLVSALGELAALGTERDRERPAASRDRPDAARLRVLAAGEAKRGKITLISTLLGRAVLPAGVTPLTAVTTVQFDDDPRAGCGSSIGPIRSTRWPPRRTWSPNAGRGTDRTRRFATARAACWTRPRR
jgi:hypothetical protein